jgi:hypothetical protein
VEEKNISKIVVGKVIQRDRSRWDRFKSIFIKGPDSRSVFMTVWTDILVPSGKHLILESVNAAVSQRLYGHPGAPRMYGGQPLGSMQYHNIGKAPIGSYSPLSDPRIPNKQPTDRSRATFDFRDIILESRAEAQHVLDNLSAILVKFDIVTVADLYEFLGVGAQYTDQRWGWTDLRSASVERTREGGYLLNLPRPEPIND